MTWTLIVLNTVVYVGTVLYSRHYAPDGLSLGYDLIHGPSDPDLFTSLGVPARDPRLPPCSSACSCTSASPTCSGTWLFCGCSAPHVEDALGPLSYLALYLGGGLAAGILHTAIKWLIPAQRYTLENR